MTIIWILILVASLVVLVKSADYFTNYAGKIGLLFGMSSFVVGATIVAIGTSLPELVSSLFAIGAGSTEFVVDNIIGSNIANALMILGIGAVFAKTLHIKSSLIDIDLPFFFSSMAIFVLFVVDGSLSRNEGILLLIFFVIFIIYNLKSGPSEVDADEMESLKSQLKHENKNHKMTRIFKYSAIVILTAGLISVGAKFLIDSVLKLSEIFGISSSVLTITVVAFGTSLPEILTSISAIKLGNHGIAIGNVLGSNTFNLLLIGGLPALISDLTVAPFTMLVGIPFLVVSTLVAIFATLDNKIRVWEGVAMLFFYLVFIAKIVSFI